MKQLVHTIIAYINNPLNNSIPRWIPWILLITFSILYFMIVIFNHFLFRTYAFDYGAYNFAFYDYAHFRISESPVYFHDHMSFLQDHLSFTLMLFIPFYWLFTWFTGTYTLLFLQTLIIIYGAWAVYRLVMLKANNNLIATVSLFMYLFLIGRWTSFFSDCNLAIIASSLIPVMLYYFERRKWLLFTLIYVFILLTREDIALWTAFIGLFYMVKYFKLKDIRYAAILVCSTSILYFILVFKVLIPAIETPEKPFLLFNYSSLGEGPFQSLLFIIKHPIRTIGLLFTNFNGDPNFDNIKTEFYIYYFLCGGFLLFFRPKYMILFIPIVARKMLNDDPIRWSMELYYSIEFVSIMPVVVGLILSELKLNWLKNVSLILTSIFVLVFTSIKLHSPNRRLNWWGDSKYAFYKKDFYTSELDVRKVNSYLNQIPDDAKISASGRLVPHLAFREKIYYFSRVEDAEYIVILKDNNTYPLTKEEYEKRLNRYIDNDLWSNVIDDSDILFLTKLGR